MLRTNYNGRSSALYQSLHARDQSFCLVAWLVAKEVVVLKVLAALLVRNICVKFALPPLKSGSDSMIATIRVYSGCDLQKMTKTGHSFQHCDMKCADNTKRKSQE